MNLGLSFLRGLIASVNPCAFVLLPTYLLYFLGIDAAASGSQRASVRRALLVSGAVAAGFIVVFVVAGVITNSFTSWLAGNAKYVTLVIGIGLVLLGAAMLFGYRLPFTAPSVGDARTDRTVRSMFVYGVAYALASLGCTIALFLATAFAPTSFAAGLANVVAFAAGMALVVMALTVSLAVANQALLRVLRSAMRYVDLVAAAFVVLSGLYLLWYFWIVDVNGERDAITDAVERVQTWVLVELSDHWQLVAAVLASIVAAAMAFVWFRRDPDPDPEPEAAAPLPSAAREP